MILKKWKSRMQQKEWEKRQIGIWARTPARQRYLEIRSMISRAPRKFITAYTDTRGKVPRPMCQLRNPWQPMKSIF